MQLLPERFQTIENMMNSVLFANSATLLVNDIYYTIPIDSIAG